MSFSQNLVDFLADIEVKAYKMAFASINHQADALDIVQDSMMKLCKNYANKPDNEWAPLFFRILKNGITDWHRKQTVKRWLFISNSNETQETDFIDQLPSGDLSAAEEMHFADVDKTISKSIRELPLRQQQCFMLRCWQGFSIEETANIMQCSQGSVKTHYSRALQKLQLLLEGKV